MKAHAVLARLLELRRRGEQRALEALIAREGDCRRARQKLETAANASLRQMAQARAQERKEIESFGGEAVSQSAILRFYAKLDAMMEEQERLRSIEETARTDLQGCTSARTDAQMQLRTRQRATAKLDEVVRRQTISLTLHQTALGEAAAEEHVAGAPASRNPDGHGA